MRSWLLDQLVFLGCEELKLYGKFHDGRLNKKLLAAASRLHDLLHQGQAVFRLEQLLQLLDSEVELSQAVLQILVRCL